MPVRSPSPKPPPRSVAVGATTAEAFAFCWRNRRDLIALASPGIIILSLVNSVLAVLLPRPEAVAPEEGAAAPTVADMLPENFLLTLLIFSVPALYFWTTFAIAWHRRYLASGDGPTVGQTLRWQAEHTRYLLLSLGLFALLGIVAAITSRLVFVGVVLVGVLYSRLVFVLPAASLNESLGYAGSWRLTDGNTFRILAIMLPVVIVLMMMAIVTSAIVMPQVTLRPTLLPLLLGSLVNQAVAFASTAIAVTALSLIYRQLRPQAPATIH